MEDQDFITNRYVFKVRRTILNLTEILKYHASREQYCVIYISNTTLQQPHAPNTTNNKQQQHKYQIDNDDKVDSR